MIWNVLGLVYPHSAAECWLRSCTLYRTYSASVNHRHTSLNLRCLYINSEIYYCEWDVTLTLELVLRTPTLQQWQVAHNVLELHCVQRLEHWCCLHRGRVAFHELQPCRETWWKVKASSTSSNVSPTVRKPDISHVLVLNGGGQF